MSSSNYNAVSSQAASESTPAIPLMMSSMGTTFAPITTVGSIGMIPIMSTPTPTPTTTMFPGSITTPGGAFTPYPSAWAQFAADPANAQALQGYQQVMAMMQQAGGFMPFAYPDMTPPIMPPPVSTPSTFVPRMVPIHPVNLTGTLNEATPSNVHEINEAEQEAAQKAGTLPPSGRTGPGVCTWRWFPWSHMGSRQGGNLSLSLIGICPGWGEIIMTLWSLQWISMGLMWPGSWLT
ncbi:unnamed protein product [Cuscuta campestris]|uniref:Uncharacterized protein n=1 Tax=Cuscuta campestris TaxID=132261 RepID=A0A484MPB4_9ASTE|nr:unnamed protein product [Cuscuta campestris]